MAENISDPSVIMSNEEQPSAIDALAPVEEPEQVASKEVTPGPVSVPLEDTAPIVDPTKPMIDQVVAPTPVPGPSAPEQQLETQEASKVEEEKKNINASKNAKAIARIQSKTPHGFGKQPTSAEIIAERRIMDAEEIEQAQIQANLTEMQKAEQDTAIINYVNDRQYAEENGIDFDEDPEMEAIIDARNKEELTKQVAAEEEIQQSVDRIEQASNPTEEEIEKTMAPIREQRKQQIVQQKAVAEETQLQEAVNKAAKDKEASDNEKVKIDPNRLWNEMSVGKKLLMALSLGASTYGSALTGSRNVGLELFMNAVNKDVQAQKDTIKLNMEQEKAYKDELYKNAQLKLDQFKAKTQSKEAHARIDHMKNQIQIQRERLSLERQEAYMKFAQIQLAETKEAQLAGNLSKPHTQEEINVLALSKPELAQAAIRFKNGKYHVSTTVAPADAKKVKEELATANSAIKGLKDLLEITDQPLASIDITGAKAKANVLQQSLKGALRLELFGPGVMTDFESKMADKIIANPASFFSLKTANKEKLNTLLQKVHHSMKEKLRIRGYNLPKSENEVRYDAFKKKVDASGYDKKTKASMLSNFIKDNPIEVGEF